MALRLKPSFGPGKEVQPSRSRQPPVIIIFADVTNTLTPEEHDSLCWIVSCLISEAPSGAELHIYPLSKDVQEAKPAAPVWTVPSRDDVGGERKIRDEAKIVADQAVKTLRDLYREINTADAVRERTCIFDALRSAENILRQKASGTGVIHVVTDMVEDCKGSYNGKTVRLNSDDIQAQIDETSKIAGDLLNLRDAAIYFHLPRHNSPKPRRDPRPPAEQRKKFWTAIVAKCRAKPAEFYYDALSKCGQQTTAP